MKDNDFKKRIGIIILLVIVVYIVRFLMIKSNIGIPCIFHELTGLYCPGCGMTRAVFMLLNFNLLGAIKSNILILVLIYFIGIYVYSYLTKKKIIINKEITITLLILVFIFFVLRNVEYFNWLRP